MVSSFSTGLLTVGLPRMAQDLNLASNLLLWYVTLSFCNYGSTIASRETVTLFMVSARQH